jgi:hypothetical protein
MDYLYYKSDWIIQSMKERPYAVLLKLYYLAVAADCLFLTGAEELKIREDGVYVLQFLWRTPTLEKLAECWRAIEEYIQFTNREAITVQEFMDAGDPHAFARMRVASDFDVYLERMGAENEEILKKK